MKVRGERISSGVDGLDELIEGGFIPGSTVMVSGKVGTGKTLFGCQFLYRGILDYGEKGVYITLEERAEDIIKDIEDTFGWDLASLQKKKMLKFISIRVRKIFHPIEKKEVFTQGFYEIHKTIVDAVKETGAKRLVIDPISIFEMMIKDKFIVRTELLHLLDTLKEMGVTSLFVAEIPESYIGGLSRSEFIEFVVDTVLKLEFRPVAKYSRSLLVKKMRRTTHSTLYHPLLIEKDGLKVLKTPTKVDEEVLEF